MPNPGLAEQASASSVASAGLPPVPEGSSAEPEDSADVLHPLTSVVLSDSQGVKRSRAGGSRASSSGRSWAIADFDRASSASTLNVPHSMFGAPKNMLRIARDLQKVCNGLDGTKEVAQAVKRIGTSGRLWARVAMPLNELVERSAQLSELAEQCERIQGWLFDLPLVHDLPNEGSNSEDAISVLQPEFDEDVIPLEKFVAGKGNS